MPTLFLATKNSHKTQEIAALLAPQWEVKDLTSLVSPPTIIEDGANFEQNACIKARTISQHVKGLVLADDSGLEVSALGGKPGIFSARFAKENASDRENNDKLLSCLAHETNREARFVCSLALGRDGHILQCFEGTVEGSILTSLHGENGFGYDPLFVPKGYAESFATLGAPIKNSISHRAKALKKLHHYLNHYPF